MDRGAAGAGVLSSGVAGIGTRLVQVAYRVPDLDAGIEEFSRSFGVGRFLVRRHVELTETLHGGLGWYDHSAAFGQWGPLMLELIEIHQARPAALAEAVLGGFGLHHVACFVDDLDVAVAEQESLGRPTVMQFVTSSGGRMSFQDARPELGHLIELCEPSEHLVAFYDQVRRHAEGAQNGTPG